jgi:hypothetical protein
MTTTPADRDYARYMLGWIDALSWPEFALAEAELPALRAYWLDGVPTDLDAIADRLWSWIDANAVESLPSDRRMILARMLLCLAAAENRELEERGYFEALLRCYGVSEQAIAGRRRDARRAAWSSQRGAPDAAPRPDAVRLQKAKTRVLLAFCVGSFLSGGAASPDPALTPLEMFWVASLTALIWMWYRLDSEQRGFQRTPGMTATVILVAIVGVPWYLIRSRGWPAAQSAVLKAIGLFILSTLLTAAGAAILAPAG